MCRWRTAASSAPTPPAPPEAAPHLRRRTYSLPAARSWRLQPPPGDKRVEVHVDSPKNGLSVETRARATYLNRETG